MFDTLLPPIYKWLRRRAGLSQEKLADALGAGRTSIYHFEHGHARPSPQQEARMVELARCSVEKRGLAPDVDIRGTEVFITLGVEAPPILSEGDFDFAQELGAPANDPDPGLVHKPHKAA